MTPISGLILGGTHRLPPASCRLPMMHRGITFVPLFPLGINIDKVFFFCFSLCFCDLKKNDDGDDDDEAYIKMQVQLFRDDSDQFD